VFRAYAVIDVFARAPLEGNPVAVFGDGSGLDVELMQRTARELQLSETVFLLAPEDPSAADARARIFTPTVELPFAGHPLLGSGFVLSGGRARTVRIQTAAGVFPVAVKPEDGEALAGELEQPGPTAEPFAPERELLDALGVSQAILPIEAYRNGPRHVYVALADEREVAELEPDLAALSRLGELGVSCFAGHGTEFKTRMFGPALGVAEDPATGSAAGPLLVHLTRHGVVDPGVEIQIRQGEEIGRPSLLRARLTAGGERVVIGGTGFVVGRGEYRLG
jgi:trans-2,3-dihydro-3-hydroxyanthranilate isomerase